MGSAATPGRIGGRGVGRRHRSTRLFDQAPSEVAGVRLGKGDGPTGPSGGVDRKTRAGRKAGPPLAAPSDEGGVSARVGIFGGPVVRRINRPVAVGLHLGNPVPVSFWHDGRLHVIDTVEDALVFSGGLAKYKVRVASQRFLLVRTARGWVLESELASPDGEGQP